MKKDNLKNYRQEKVQKNLLLVKRAIEHLKKYELNISLSNVSKITYDIANESERGMTIAGLSQNKTYKNLIEQEQHNQVLKENKNSKKKQEYSSKTLKQMSEAELIAEIYKLKAKVIEKKDNNELLKDIMIEHNTQEKQMNNASDYKELSLALEHVLEVLLEKEILFIDKNTFDVKLSVYGTHLLNGSLFEKIFKERKNDYKKGNN